jgi:DNA (cytosine-5)-methyltransferase 1
MWAETDNLGRLPPGLIVGEPGEPDKLVRLPSGLIVSEDVAEDYFRSMQRPVAIDLFAGCGGMSCGLVQGGFDVIGAADSDAPATMTYMWNLGAYPCKFHFATPEDEQRMEKEILRSWERRKGEALDGATVSGSGWIKNQGPGLRGCEHFFFGDVRKLTGKQILDAIGMDRGEVDMVAGGPPCQGYSRANGRRNVMDPRNSLVFEFARLVCEIQPKAMVFENVPGILDMVTPEGMPVVDALCRVLEDGGMGTYEGMRNVLAGKPDARGILRTEAKRESRKKTKKKGRKKIQVKAPEQSPLLFGEMEG